MQALRPIVALRLRQDLRLYKGQEIAHAPTWTLYDPARHRYFQIDRATFAVLSAWQGSLTAQGLHARVDAVGDVLLGEAEVERVFDFAERNELVDESAQGWRSFAARKEAARSSAFMWLIHNYLFIKLPLVRPRTFFERTGFLVAPLYTRTFLDGTALAALAASYLVARQWNTFVDTFPGFFSFEGAMTYGATLFGVKVVHELGHAYTAARYRCRIASMGLAFMVMVPMLYCDVTDSWKLWERRKRMAIDAAGILAELVLAIYAALLWVMLPEGGPRTAAFLVCTASLVSSLLVNLNPLMRFDGYLILSDAMNVPNLQTRAFELMRWRLREELFRLGAPKPDAFGSAKETAVLAYGCAILVYRAVLYAGIALLVYREFFKLLGIVLFLVEIGWFIAGPVMKEIHMWWRLRGEMNVNPRSIATAAISALIVFLLVFPFHARVGVPAVLEPASFARVFPASPGRIVSVSVQRGDEVAAGETLATLVSPQIDRDASLARIRLALVDARLSRRSSVAEDKAATLSLEMERRLLTDRIAGLERERAELVLKSPIAGIVRDLDPDLETGRWVNRDAEIALVVAPDADVVRGYVRDGKADLLAIGAGGTFYPDSFVAGSQPARLTSVAYAASPRIDILSLASTNGGPIAARPTSDHGFSPDYAIYPASFAVGDAALPRVQRGIVLIDGERESIAAAAVRNLARVLVRESGF